MSQRRNVKTGIIVQQKANLLFAKVVLEAHYFIGIP